MPLSKSCKRLPLTARYLLAYLIYNDGIQTVVFAASAFLEQELFPGGNPVFLLQIFVMVQFVAVVGALLFERLAYLINTKNAIIVSLVIWSGIVIYANRFLDTVPEAWFMAAHDCDRAGRFAGAFTIALLADDSAQAEKLRFLVFTRFRNAALRGWDRCCSAS